MVSRSSFGFFFSSACIFLCSSRPGERGPCEACERLSLSLSLLPALRSVQPRTIIQDELALGVALLEPRIVDLEHADLQLARRLRVLLVEGHFGQQVLGFVVVLCVELPAQAHVAGRLRVGDGLAGRDRLREGGGEGRGQCEGSA